MIPSVSRICLSSHTAACPVGWRECAFEIGSSGMHTGIMAYTRGSAAQPQLVDCMFVCTLVRAQLGVHVRLAGACEDKLDAELQHALHGVFGASEQLILR